MTVPEQRLRPRPARPVDLLLVRVRWLLWVLVIPIALFESGSLLPSLALLGWFLYFPTYNLVTLAFLHRKNVPGRIPQLTLAVDAILFAGLPLLAGGSPVGLYLFGLFPTIVAALRFGPSVGTLVAAVLALPVGLRALLALLPPLIRGSLPFFVDPNPNLASLGLVAIALFAAVILVGYLAEREREAAVGAAAVELAELRQAVAGAHIFYQTADTLSSTLNYGKVLEGMLEAGIKDLPATRREDPLPVGLALFFTDEGSEKLLRVVAYRHLDRGDVNIRIRGQEGCVAEVLRTGEPVVFTNAAQDPELSRFAALRRCKAGACYPLQAGLDQYGVVVLSSPTPRPPTAGTLELMRAFTNQAAIAFQNTRLYTNLRAERDRIVDGEVQARAKLARDLHDGPVQSLATTSMRLDFIRRLIRSDPDQAESELAELHEYVTRTSKEMRDLLFTLRPLTLESDGLSAAVRQLGEKLRVNEGVPVEISPGDFGPELDPSFASTVFSIVEEALNNARKYSGGAPVQIALARQSETLVATVQDRGPGFDLSAVDANYTQRGSLGLLNMRERAQMLDGQLTIDSSPGYGTRVMLIAPLPQALGPA